MVPIFSYFFLYLFILSLLTQGWCASWHRPPLGDKKPCKIRNLSIAHTVTTRPRIWRGVRVIRVWAMGAMEKI